MNNKNAQCYKCEMNLYITQYYVVNDRDVKQLYLILWNNTIIF